MRRFKVSDGTKWNAVSELLHIYALRVFSMQIYPVNVTSALAQVMVDKGRKSVWWMTSLISVHSLHDDAESEFELHHANALLNAQINFPLQLLSAFKRFSARCWHFDAMRPRRQVTSSTSSSSCAGTSDLLLGPLPFLLRGSREGEGDGRESQDSIATSTPELVHPLTPPPPSICLYLSSNATDNLSVTWKHTSQCKYWPVFDPPSSGVNICSQEVCFQSSTLRPDGLWEP